MRNTEWLNWITKGKATYIDKEKIQTLIDQQRTNLAEVEYMDLNSFAKVMENFDSSKSFGKKKKILSKMIEYFDIIDCKIYDF